MRNRQRYHGPLVMSLALLLCAYPDRLSAQSRPVTQPTTSAPALLAGVLAAAGGFVAGGLIGVDAVCNDGSCGDDGGLAGAFYGAVIGEALLLPIGVHLGNRSAGALDLDILVSAAVAGASVGLAFATENGGFLFAGFFAQLGLTIWTERKTGRSTGLLRNADLLIQPSRGGELLVGLSLR